jgi:hypothetical protein
MNIKTLKKMLREICDDGYGNWVPRFYGYTINHIYIDDDGDICLQSSDCEDDPYDFTAWNILKRLNDYYPKSYVYFEEEYYDDCDDECYDYYDIEYNWYIDTWYDDDENEDVEELYIDCCEMD